ncbi:hypothetical protein M413DRAFT_424627 [Hebeloma cylindrosporum]|uniref:Uncharacterized protein n=1 Tax=Hebeloma cylindrosporum TaxID=76867 RepID=A0A0C2Y678_HEBCY|nr:hypothetical protein M413DRAFT_424627 [Hebeloma cylindrosporum h7]
MVVDTVTSIVDGYQILPDVSHLVYISIIYPNLSGDLLEGIDTIHFVLSDICSRFSAGSSNRPERPSRGKGLKLRINRPTFAGRLILSHHTGYSSVQFALSDVRSLLALRFAAHTTSVTADSRWLKPQDFHHPRFECLHSVDSGLPLLGDSSSLSSSQHNAMPILS